MILPFQNCRVRLLVHFIRMIILHKRNPIEDTPLKFVCYYVDHG